MSQQSSSTLLDVVNDLLGMVGERRVTSLASPTALLAKSAVKNALNDIATVHDFSWLRVTIPAISWTGNKALLGDIIRVWSVVSGTASLGFSPLNYVTPDVFDTLDTTQSYNSTTTPGYPYWWTKQGFNEVLVSPYPTDSTEQAKVLFRVTKAFDLPELTTDKLPLPEQYITLLKYRAASDFALEHLDDAQLASQFMARYETMTQRVRSRDVLIPATGYTMRRRGRY
jgi:hypothetical protein